MRVLVVVPAQLGRPFLSEALESLSRQTRHADEIIVAIGQTPLHERLNDAIDASDCDAFIVLCDDDLLEPTYIEKTVARMVETGADVVYTDLRHFGTRDAVWIAPPPDPTPDPDPNPLPVTSLCRKGVWAEIGGYTLGPYFDWDFWWSAIDAGATLAKVAEPLFLYRNHLGQASITQTQESINECEAIIRQRHQKQ
jgi:glycosyltransferase involved in cell wall biosynthesis